jgi:hypothetical protein
MVYYESRGQICGGGGSWALSKWKDCWRLAFAFPLKGTYSILTIQNVVVNGLYFTWYVQIYAGSYRQYL